MIFKRNFGRFFGKNFERSLVSFSFSNLKEGVEFGISVFLDQETPFCISIAFVKFIFYFSVLEIVFNEY